MFHVCKLGENGGVEFGRSFCGGGTNGCKSDDAVSVVHCSCGFEGVKEDSVNGEVEGQFGDDVGDDFFLLEDVWSDRHGRKLAWEEKLDPKDVTGSDVVW